MKKCAVIISAILSLLAAAGHVASLVANYWTIKTIKVLKITTNIGLFRTGCINNLCSQSEIADQLSSNEIGWKVAASGIILAAICSFCASIVLVISTCRRNSTIEPKVSGILLLFAVIFTIVGVVVYVYFELLEAQSTITVSFGYSMYTACAAGALCFLASMTAFAGA